MAAEKKAATPTEYLVLRTIVSIPEDVRNTEHGWKKVATITAASAQSAIRAAVAKLVASEQAGTFVAVPARSWRPTKVAPKTTVQLELTEVKP